MSKVYRFRDGEFTFHTAMYGSWKNDQMVVFRVRTTSTPQKRAEEKGIKYYDWIVPATDEEISLWLEKHPDYALE